MSCGAGDEYGRHVVPAREGAEVIEWIPQPPRVEGVRVRDYTCDCQPISYELCQAGGVRFVRRIRRVEGKVLVDECPGGVASPIDALWERLLRGQAR